MAGNRGMVPCILQKMKTQRTKSGADKSSWVLDKIIKADIRKKDETKVYASAVYVESTHSCLTYCKGIKKNQNRIIKDGVPYTILSVNEEARLTNMLLKRVE